MSTNKACIIEAIKLHRKQWFKNCIQTILSGFAYDDFENGEDNEDQSDKKVNEFWENNPDYERIVYRKKKRLQKRHDAAFRAAYNAQHTDYPEEHHYQQEKYYHEEEYVNPEKGADATS